MEESIFVTDFVTYDIAKSLKDLGFNEKCFGYFNEKKSFFHHEHPQAFYTRNDSVESYCTNIFSKRVTRANACQAPLWQQVTDWLRIEHKININFDFVGIDSCSYIVENLNKIDPNFSTPEFLYVSDMSKSEDFMSYYNARKYAILKAIEIIRNK
jgi:hypothetical protein